MPAATDRARRSLKRVEALDTERVFRDALFANRPDLGEGRIRAPAPREKIAARFGGGRRGTAEYDWFWELAPEEQARIRQNWMTPSRSAISPDEVEAMGLPIEEWLALTRGIDAARAVATGRELQPKRYGGRNPLAYISRGDPDDEGERVSRFTTRRASTPDRDVRSSEGVQFFTDENGVVHPIRASYESRTGGRGPMSAAEIRERYGDDEAF